MMKYLTKEVRIGIAGIIALCILVYGINYLKGIHMFKPTNYFYVKFHNINGLTKSSPVFADGFRVGIVRDLYYDYNEPGKVVAEIDVDPELRIPKGSTAELASELMGGVKMNLLLANNPREKYLTGDTLQGNVNNGPGSHHHASGRKDASQARLYPCFTEYNPWRPGNSRYTAQRAKHNGKHGSHQQTVTGHYE
jgi:hypothetical protein